MPTAPRTRPAAQESPGSDAFLFDRYGRIRTLPVTVGKARYLIEVGLAVPVARHAVQLRGDLPAAARGPARPTPVRARRGSPCCVR